MSYTSIRLDMADSTWYADGSACTDRAPDRSYLFQKAPARFSVGPTSSLYRQCSPTVVHCKLKDSTLAFQKQMMMWARMDNHEKYREPLSDDTQSSTSTASRTGRFSAASSEDLPAVTKDQLEFYLKRHLDDSRQEEFRV
uniref:Uncharacterized protein n=1 Tax=Hyaloperonospora arabidopsidis (strain Emoy2) TaxID=559515 RepID=M4BBJ2_HYAAE